MQRMSTRTESRQAPLSDGALHLSDTRWRTESRRRCCICFGLKQDNAEKKGQIAHLDHDPSNNAPDNLAFLCFDRHDQYDTPPSQAKGLTIEEVKRYRTELLAFVARKLPAPDAEITSVGQENFDWIVNAVAEMAVKLAQSGEGPGTVSYTNLTLPTIYAV